MRPPWQRPRWVTTSMGRSYRQPPGSACRGTAWHRGGTFRPQRDPGEPACHHVPLPAGDEYLRDRRLTATGTRGWRSGARSVQPQPLHVETDGTSTCSGWPLPSSRTTPTAPAPGSSAWRIPRQEGPAARLPGGGPFLDPRARSRSPSGWSPALQRRVALGLRGKRLPATSTRYRSVSPRGRAPVGSLLCGGAPWLPKRGDGGRCWGRHASGGILAAAGIVALTGQVPGSPKIMRTPGDWRWSGIDRGTGVRSDHGADQHALPAPAPGAGSGAYGISWGARHPDCAGRASGW